MVRRIEESVRFVSESETTVPIEELGAAVVTATEAWFRKKIELGEHGWVRGGGGAPGYHTGLQEAVDDKLNSVAEGCGVDCTLRVELPGASSGIATNCSLSLACNSFSSNIEPLIQEQEEACLAHQRDAVGKFQSWVVSNADEIKSRETQVRQATEALALEQAELKRIV